MENNSGKVYKTPTCYVVDMVCDVIKTSDASTEKTILDSVWSEVE